MNEIGALQRCVGDVERFSEEFWGTRVLVRGPEPDGFADLLSLDDVDALLTGYGVRTPGFRLVRDGRPLPAAEVTRTARIGQDSMTGLADPALIFSAVEQGATLVLQGLQRCWPPLMRFCRDLEISLGHQCQVNAYITPAESQGFRPHTDTHDVFVLQAFGRKTWQLWPSASSGHAADSATPEHATNTSDDEVEHVELEPGSAVYLPTGTRHAARTQHVLSGHLTIGIHPTRWRHVLETAVRQLLDDGGFDEPLPVGFHRQRAELADQLDGQLQELGTRTAKLDAHEIADGTADRFLTHRPSLLRGGLVDRMRLADLDDTGHLRRRPGAICEIRTSADGPVRLLLGDRDLRIPRWVEPALRHIAATDSFTVGDLAPHLDPTSRLVLVRRLVREGLLEVADD